MYYINNANEGLKIIFPWNDRAFFDPCLIADIYARTDRFLIIITTSTEAYKIDCYRGVDFTQGAFHAVYHNAREIMAAWVRVYCIGTEGITVENDPLFMSSEAANFEAGDKDKLDGLILVGWGARQTGIHAGLHKEVYFDDDAMYVCVVPGPIGVAVWKKTWLFNT